MSVADNLRRVRERIESAARRAGRAASEVTLVAVAKTKPAPMLDEAIAAGAAAIGENYVQEARDKKPLVRGAATWHFIGHLQRNKARLAVDLFDVIQTIDDLALARTLDRLAGESGRPLPALIEVNVGGEARKSGVAPDALEPLLEQVATLEHLRVEGLMTIPPADDDPRPHFAALRRLRERFALPQLSMGMTDDFEIAIEEGATIVRVGRAIFGERG